MSTAVGYLPGESWLVAGDRAVVYTGGEASDAMRWWPSVRSGAGAADLIGEVFRDGALGSDTPLAIVCTEADGTAADGTAADRTALDPHGTGPDGTAGPEGEPAALDKGTTVRVLVQGDLGVVVETVAGEQVTVTGAGLVTWSEVVVARAAVVYVECVDTLPSAADLLPMPAGVVRAGSVRWELCDVLVPPRLPAAGVIAQQVEPVVAQPVAQDESVDAVDDVNAVESIAEPDEPEELGEPEEQGEPEVLGEPDVLSDPEVDESVTVISMVPQTDPSAPKPDVEFVAADAVGAPADLSEPDGAVADASAEAPGSQASAAVEAPGSTDVPGSDPAADGPDEPASVTPPAAALAALAALSSAKRVDADTTQEVPDLDADDLDGSAARTGDSIEDGIEPGATELAEADAADEAAPDLGGADDWPAAEPAVAEAVSADPGPVPSAMPEQRAGLSTDNPFPPITLPPFTPPPFTPPTFSPPTVSPPPFVPASTTLPPVGELIEHGPDGVPTGRPPGPDESATAVIPAEQPAPGGPPVPAQQQPDSRPAEVEQQHQTIVPVPYPVGDHDGLTQLAEDLPADYHPPQMPPAPAAGQVYASICPAGHANAPHSGNCRVCGAPIAAAEPVLAARPLLGRIRLSTGPVFDLDRRIVIGRAPSVSRVSSSELPRLVTVPSPNQDISRSHVEVRTEDWHLVVADLNSTNGTVVRAPNRPDQLLHPGQTVVAEIGWTIDLGDGISFLLEGAS